MKYIWIWFMLFVGLGYAHPEPVAAVLHVKPRATTSQIELQMVGQQSTLPIRGAEVYLYFYPLTPELEQKLRYGQISSTNDRILPLDAIIKLRLEEQNTTYQNKVSLPTGEYAVAVVDSTFKGENAIAIAPLSWHQYEVLFQVVLPKTNTPNSYLWYAIGGLGLPLLVGIGLALGRKKS